MGEGNVGQNNRADITRGKNGGEKKTGKFPKPAPAESHKGCGEKMKMTKTVPKINADVLSREEVRKVRGANTISLRERVHQDARLWRGFKTASVGKIIKGVLFEIQS